MRRLLCVGDGERDRTVLPALVESLLGEQIETFYEDWRQQRSPRGGRGFDAKVMAALDTVVRFGLDGLVAVLDRDTAPPFDRLRDARAGRARHRRRFPSAPSPAALGEAAPHFESWLLDDEQAVKVVLAIAPGVRIPLPHRCRSPKVELERLIADAGRPDRDDAKAEIAAGIDPARCRRGKRTGFADFLTDLHAEFPPAA